jgi:hypothetical protein
MDVSLSIVDYVAGDGDEYKSESVEAIKKLHVAEVGVVDIESALGSVYDFILLQRQGYDAACLRSDVVGTASSSVVSYGDLMRIGSVICDLRIQRSFRVEVLLSPESG